jgi:N-acetylglucosamine-6-sulfatase
VRSLPTRKILKTAAVAGIGVLIAGGCADSPPSERPVALPSRPNIVFVLADDLDATSPYWEAMPKTRALIRDRGLVFDNAFVTNPVCAPSRATILTGLYSHNNGVYASDGGAAYSAFAATAETRTMAVRLHDAGYTTAFLGKYVNGYERTPQAVPPGWDEWFGLAGDFTDGYTYTANHNGRIVSYGTAEDDYQTDVLSRHAGSFVRQREAKDDKPLFLFLAPSAGHWSMKPAPRHATNPFADAGLPRRPNFNEDDLSDKPLWLRQGGWELDVNSPSGETEHYRRAMGSLLAVDDMVGAVADELRESGELDETIFVFTSDNGYNRGAHRLHNKLAPYEESIRVPLAVAGPGVRKGVDDRLVINTDLAPSVLALAGVTAQNDTDGRSLVPLLRGEDVSWRTDFLLEYRGDYSTFVSVRTLADVRSRIERDGSVDYMPSYLGLRSQEWLYVEWYEGDEHEIELYDMSDDPYQLTNLVATAESAARHTTITDGLHARLVALAACNGAPCR